MPQPASPERSRPPHPISRLRRALAAKGSRVVAPLTVLAMFVIVAAGNIEISVGFHAQSAAWRELLVSGPFWALLLTGLTLVLALPFLSLFAGSVLTAVAGMHVFWLGYATLPQPPVPTEFSMFTVLIVYVVHLAQRYAESITQKQEVIDTIGQYIPAPLAAQIARDPRAGALRAESRELSVLFCDVHGFTRIAETLPPEELSEMLNALLTPLTRIVHQHGGTIDKYIGDALMAFWGAPESDTHHAAHAITAALEIQDAAMSLRERFVERGWPALELGIGINTGMASVGNMGSEFRVAYTAIGDAVNLAARLERLTRIYHTGIIVGEGTRRAFSAISYRELGLIEIKGKQEPARVYEPIDPALNPDDTVLVSTRRHNDALRCYYARDWDDARERFQALAARHPDDPLYSYYLQRIEHFEHNPPPDDWRGEIRYTLG